MPAILNLKFPFELKPDQSDAVNSWIKNDCKGSVIFSTGTGKTEIAFECARRAAELKISEYKNAFESDQKFRILFLIPRIVLIEQNIKRLVKYGISENEIGVYYGERKEIKEITISTYQSIINNTKLLRSSNMVILDEIHLISETARVYNKIFNVLLEDPQKAILGLTATINEKDSRYGTILEIAPPVKKYMIGDAVIDGRLANPEIIPISVLLTRKEQEIHKETSSRINNISNQLEEFDAQKISLLLKTGGYRSKLAKSWFENVRIRKDLLSEAQNKLEETVNIIKKHNSEPIMIFSETIKSLKKIEKMLQEFGIESRTIHSGMSATERKKILDEWGKMFCPLLSIHTLEIGYDIPNVRIAIIISNSSNVSQIAQRIGRVIRKASGKSYALIYLIFVKDTKDNKILRMVKSIINEKTVRKGETTTRQLKLSFFK